MVNKEIIYGRNSVIEALKSPRITAEKLYIPQTEVDPALAKIRRLAESMGIPCKSADKKKLDDMARNGNHQGVVLKVAVRSYTSYEDLIAIPSKKGEIPFFLGCFQVQDPHNLGALIRTADGAGVHGILIPKNKSVGLTGAVSKTASGADAYVPVCRVDNLYETILDMKKRGIIIIGSCPFKDEDCISYRKADYKKPICILIGAEGRGLDKRLLSTCDIKVHIPLKGNIESLNASVAGGLLMYEAMNSRI